MKRLYYIFFLPIFPLNAQQYYDTVHYNSINALVSNYGTYFQDLDQNMGRFEIPFGSGDHYFDGAKILVGGKDSNGQLYLNQGGTPSAGRDFFPGPFSNLGIYQSTGNAIYSICQAEIDNFRLWWECEMGLATTGCDNAQVPSNSTLATIYQWPAHGDVSIGQSYYLAPFFDYDHDAFYNPDNGDYPLISGCCETLLIQNDGANLHTYSETPNMGIEVHTRFDTYADANYLDTTLFIDVQVINRGTRTFSEFFLSVLLDSKIGFYQDDYFGCDSNKNMVYFYNKDNDDVLLGQNPSALGIYSLNGNLSSVVPYVAGGASSIYEMYNNMNGLKGDGSAWINPAMLPSKFVFEGNPYSSTGWIQSNSLSDKRVFANINCGTFIPQDTIRKTFAISYSRAGNNMENVQNLIDLSQSINQFYELQSSTFCYDEFLEINELERSFSLSPNPSKGAFTINGEIKENSMLRIYDLIGNLILEAHLLGASTTINIDKAGVFLVEISSNSSRIVKKVIVN